MNHNDPHFEESTHGEISRWFQENLRVIVSIFIVAAIALGIYSYSQRANNLSDEDIASLLDTKGGEEQKAMDGEKMSPEEAPVSKGTVVTPELSQETDGSFVETAEKGDGLTHLARRALTHTLEQNSDWNLSAEQKVFVEDYLRKNVGHGAIAPGATVEFSKSTINQAVDAAKNLSPAQLENLKKWSSRVNSYR
jgi:hypothetical protein